MNLAYRCGQTAWNAKPCGCGHVKGVHKRVAHGKDATYTACRYAGCGCAEYAAR